GRTSCGTRSTRRRPPTATSETRRGICARYIPASGIASPTSIGGSASAWGPRPFSRRGRTRGPVQDPRHPRDDRGLHAFLACGTVGTPCNGSPLLNTQIGERREWAVAGRATKIDLRPEEVLP